MTFGWQTNCPLSMLSKLFISVPDYIACFFTTHGTNGFMSHPKNDSLACNTCKPSNITEARFILPATGIMLTLQLNLMHCGLAGIQI